MSFASGCRTHDHPVTYSLSTPGIHRTEAAFVEPSGWLIHADAPWWGLVDLRNMLNLFHPLVVSTTGATAGASRAFVVGADWKPPFALRFYCADNYVADPIERPGALGVENYVGHRYKQVLVDDRVVWERDVADAATHDAPTEYTVDLTPYVRPGQTFRLTLRVLDRSTTLERHDGDVRFVPGTWYSVDNGGTEQPPRFHTQVWFADPVFGETEAVRSAPRGARPHEAEAAEHHRRRGPLTPRGAPAAAGTTLELLAPDLVPGPGFPIETGIPVPMGSLRDAGAARLAGPDGNDVPLQTRAAAYWPDGTVRWFVLQAVLPAGTRPHDRFALQLDGASLPRRAPHVTSTRAGPTLRVDTGALVLETGTRSDVLIDAVYAAPSAGPLLRDARLRMAIRVGGRTVPIVVRRSDVEVIDEGSVASTFEIRGSLEAPLLHVGRFVLRVTAFAGMPTLKLALRVIDDVKPSPYVGTSDDAPLEIEDLTIVATASAGAHPRAGLDGVVVSTGSALEVLQGSFDEAVVRGQDGGVQHSRRIDGWMATDTVEMAGWRFAEQYPKAMRMDGGRLELGLFRSTLGMPFYRPRFGEAKRHDVWLRFFPDHTTDSAFAALANSPPRLFDATWFATSGAAGVYDPAWFAHQPEIEKWARHLYGEVLPADWPGHFGIRDFGDAPYKPPQWLNGYWAMIRGSAAWAFAGASPRWLERAHEVARHVADVDSVHLRTDDPDFDRFGGITCALCQDHSTHGGPALWSAFQAGDQLLLDAWLTGDRDSLADGLANADYLVRSGNGVGANGVRDQTRPILVLLNAWETTRDTRYLDAARRYLDLDAMRSTLLDFRRGAYVTPIYKNWWVVSAGLDAAYALAVDEYYRLTGDAKAAQLEVAIADSVYAESMLPQEEALGSFLFYPRYDRGARYFPQMALLFHVAFDLTLDRRFLRAARAAFARYLVARNADGTPSYQPVGNFGYLDPELGAWMLEHRDVTTRPFAVLGQVPEPDPSAFDPRDP